MSGRIQRSTSAMQTSASTVGLIERPAAASTPLRSPLAANAPSRTPGHSRGPPRNITPSARPAAGHTAIRPERTGAAQARCTAAPYSTATPTICSREDESDGRRVIIRDVGACGHGLSPRVSGLPLARLATVEPLAHRRVMRRVLAGVQLGPQLAELPKALGHDVVLVDGLEVLLARRDEGVRQQLRETLDD